MSTPIVRRVGMASTIWPLDRCPATQKSPVTSSIAPPRVDCSRACAANRTRRPAAAGRATAAARAARAWRGRGDGRPAGPESAITPLRVLKWLALAIVGWLLLSLVLFLISASDQRWLPAQGRVVAADGRRADADVRRTRCCARPRHPTERPARARRSRALTTSDRQRRDRHDDAVADRRRHVAPPLDPARHVGQHPGRRPHRRSTLPGRSAVPRSTIKVVEQFTGLQDQPHDRRQPRQLPEVHRRHRRRDRQDGADLLEDLGRRGQRRLHAEPRPGIAPPRRDPGDDARAHP